MGRFDVYTVAVVVVATLQAMPARAWDVDPERPCVGYDKTTRGSGQLTDYCLRVRNDCGKSVEGFVRTEAGQRLGTGLVADKQTGKICISKDFRYVGSKMYNF